MIRTRFAPSPTGHLHLGSARVALFCWLVAMSEKGEFWLRIEDTDPERSQEIFTQSIIESLNWLGLDFKGPIYQSKRLEYYQKTVQTFLSKGLAYKCYCSRERLQALREQQTARKEKPRYDGHCRELAASKTPSQGSYVIRFKTPLDGTVQFEDLIHGLLSVNNAELDDLIIAREGGFPTYNFAAVLDDLDMKITQVIRGDDHLTNTFRQVHIFKALGAPLPTYVHIPMILGKDGGRLSKRHGATSILEYRQAGYLPDALLNYLARLGWAHGDQEVFTRQELIEFFDIHKVQKSAATFNPEKLLWINQQHLKNTDPKILSKHLLWHFSQMGIDSKNGPPLEDVLLAQRERGKTLQEVADKSRYFYQDLVTYDSKAASLHLTANRLPAFKTLFTLLSDLSHWEESILHKTLLEAASTSALTLGELAGPLRVAMTGDTVSPPIGTTLSVIGKARVLLRLEKAILFLEEKHLAS